MGLVRDILNDIRKQIAPSDRTLEEARRRRDLVAEASMKLEGALRWFRSGSVGHGMVNKPVSDADSGIVLDRRNERYARLGPDGVGEGPEEVVDELCDLIRNDVRKDYPEANVGTSRRGILVEFNEPRNDEEDPSVDHIVTLTRKDADGLWIPDLDAGREEDRWTASHPEKHTELFTSGARDLRSLRARVARLAKAWNGQWDEGDRALSSFNIVTLAWEYIDDPSVPLDEALAGWFAYARDEIRKRETEDPARVSDPIRLLLTRNEVVERLADAAKRLRHALDNEEDEDAVKRDLADVYPDYVKPPASKESLADALRRGNSRVGATSTGISLGGATAIKTTRAYGGERDE
jgi:hypothetical protein